MHKTDKSLVYTWNGVLGAPYCWPFLAKVTGRRDFRVGKSRLLCSDRRHPWDVTGKLKEPQHTHLMKFKSYKQTIRSSLRLYAERKVNSIFGKYISNDILMSRVLNNKITTLYVRKNVHINRQGINLGLLFVYNRTDWNAWLRVNCSLKTMYCRVFRANNTLLSK